MNRRLSDEEPDAMEQYDEDFGLHYDPIRERPLDLHIPEGQWNLEPEFDMPEEEPEPDDYELLEDEQ